MNRKTRFQGVCTYAGQKEKKESVAPKKLMTKSSHWNLAALCIVGLAVSFCSEAPKPSKSKPADAYLGQQNASPQQETFPVELMRELEATKVAALADDYAYRQLAHLTENIGPRLSGSPAAKAAVEYVAAQMRDLGLDVHLEQVKVPHWVRGIETAELIDGPGFTPGTQRPIVLTALGGSTSTGSNGLTADLVVVENFDQLKALGHDKIAGKIVLFNVPFDKQKAAAGAAFQAYRELVAYRETGPQLAAELGAVAAIVRSIGSGNSRLPHTGDSDPAEIPAAAICAEDADLIAHLATESVVRMHLTVTPQKLPDEISFNAIGDLKGSEHPDQVVIVSAHLDSWDLGTGAIDDAAGVAITLQTARLFQQLHLHPKRTVRVIAWMDEERDGSGSNQYMKDHGGEFPNYIAAIESDAGVAHPLGFAANVSKSAVDAFRPAQTVLSSIGATVLDTTSRVPGTTDIAPMSQRGVPIFGILVDQSHYYDYHHSAADTLDKIVPSELRENAAVIAVMTYALANMTNPLPR